MEIVCSQQWASAATFCRVGGGGLRSWVHAAAWLLLQKERVCLGVGELCRPVQAVRFLGLELRLEKNVCR